MNAAKVLGFAFVIMALVSCVTVTNENEMPMSERRHDVIIETGRSRAGGYRIANEWAVDVFNSAERFIQYQDNGETTGQTQLDAVVIGKMSTNIILDDYDVVIVDFILTVDIREGRSRVTFDHMTVDNSNAAWLIAFDYYSPEVHTEFVEFADTLAGSLEAAMKEDRRW